MPKAKKNKIKLSIYLVKQGQVSDINFIKIENTNPPHEVKIPSSKGTLYVKKDIEPHSPKWTSFLCKDQEFTPDIFGKGNTVGAALVIRAHERIFILTFGSGHHLLINESVERDFGLRITLNSVSPEKLRSLDKSNYEDNPLNSRNQSPRGVEIFDLEIDSETDMLYAITGASAIKAFGGQVTGRDALIICPEATIETLPGILLESLTRYQMKLPESFEWVDNINKVKDIDTMLLLDMELDEQITRDKEFSHYWLGEPEIVDWETQYGYSFDQRYKTALHPTLEIKDLAEYIAKQTKESLSVETLKKHTIHVNDSNHRSIKSWSAYRCLYAEIIYGKEQYILRNGIWYKVNQDFIRKIDNFLSRLQPYEFQLPIYNHEKEDEYNSHVADNNKDFILFDKKNVHHGGSRDKIEFCDLVRNNTELIHVKYYRGSSTLSHLFSQGCVAAEAFVSDAEFRKKLNKKLPEPMKLNDIETRPKSSDFSIIYAIAVNREIPLKLPFFSKITLKNAFKTLTALDFNVRLARIEVDKTLAAKKIYRPSK